MILIVTETSENSTDEVIEWVRSYNKRVVRVNFEDEIKIKSVKYLNKKAVVAFMLNTGETINSDEITSYWYRRGDFSLPVSNNYETNIRNPELNRLVINNLYKEILTIRDLLYYIFQNKTSSIGNFYSADNNKLVHISIARAAGLDTPESIVCTSKKELIAFCKSSPNGIITKSMSNGIVYSKRKKKGNTLYAQYTCEITDDVIAQIPSSFFPTLLQEKINKKFELRIFYLKGELYPMAIFSQNDEQTKVDFRRYNHKKPNRRVPYKLPPDLQKKLKNFMRNVNLDTGSIDMIYSTDNKFYFLEVNPIGQFGMVSYPCNYKLEKKIALQLVRTN